MDVVNNTKWGLIDLQIGEIIGNSEFYRYKIKINPKGNIKICDTLLGKWGELLFILIFGVFGPLLTLFFHHKCFKWFNKMIRNDYLQPFTYKTLNNGVVSRIILFLISLLISFSTPLLFLYKVIGSTPILNLLLGFDLGYIGNINDEYDWSSLYKSLKENGYNPEKFGGGYITVEKFKDKYICVDGNHRHFILSNLYNKDKKIRVKLLGITYS